MELNQGLNNSSAHKTQQKSQFKDSFSLYSKLANLGGGQSIYILSQDSRRFCCRRIKDLILENTGRKIHFQRLCLPNQQISMRYAPARSGRSQWDKGKVKFGRSCSHSGSAQPSLGSRGRRRRVVAGSGGCFIDPSPLRCGLDFSAD